MIDLGISKMALIGAVALIVIGPEKLPRVARTVGTLLGKAQRYVADVKNEVNRSMELDELKKMKETMESAARDVQGSVQPTTLSNPGTRPPHPWSKRPRQSMFLPWWFFPNTSIPARNGASSKAPRPNGSKRAQVCARGRSPGLRGWPVFGPVPQRVTDRAPGATFLTT
jgi:Tat protein translocase TatB subunit